MARPNGLSIHDSIPLREVTPETDEQFVKRKAEERVFEKIKWSERLDATERAVIQGLIRAALGNYTPRMIVQLLSGLDLPGGQVAVLSRHSIWGLAYIDHPHITDLIRVIAVCILCFNGPEHCECDLDPAR